MNMNVKTQLMSNYLNHEFDKINKVKSFCTKIVFLLY